MTEIQETPVIKPASVPIEKIKLTTLELLTVWECDELSKIGKNITFDFDPYTGKRTLLTKED